MWDCAALLRYEPQLNGLRIMVWPQERQWFSKPQLECFCPDKCHPLEGTLDVAELLTMEGAVALGAAGLIVFLGMMLQAAWGHGDGQDAKKGKRQKDGKEL